MSRCSSSVPLYSVERARARQGGISRPSPQVMSPIPSLFLPPWARRPPARLFPSPLGVRASCPLFFVAFPPTKNHPLLGGVALSLSKGRGGFRACLFPSSLGAPASYLLSFLLHLLGAPPSCLLLLPSPPWRGGPELVEGPGWVPGARFLPLPGVRPSWPLAGWKPALPGKETHPAADAAQRGSVSSTSPANAGHVSSFPPRRG